MGDHQQHFTVGFSSKIEDSVVGLLNAWRDSALAQPRIDALTEQVKNLTARLHKTNDGLENAVKQENK